jgi:hypothetical protein
MWQVAFGMLKFSFKKHGETPSRLHEKFKQTLQFLTVSSPLNGVWRVPKLLRVNSN